MGDEVPDARRPLLPVPVDASVALLKLEKRPRDVEVNQFARKIVQVEALGGHVGGEQHPYRSPLDPEFLDDLLRLDVGALTGGMQGLDLLLR